MTNNTYLRDGSSINIAVIDTAEDGNIHRSVLTPGHVQNGAWADTDLSTYPPEAQTLAAELWTPEAVAVVREAALASLPVLTEADYSRAIQGVIDTMAQSHNYADGVSLASYKDSTVPNWAAEASAFIAWRDAVWSYVYSQLAAVQAQERNQPTVSGLIGELPAITWP
ncbi:MAG: hypothetical protein QM780_16445 [Hyphomicrobium sp.]|uniref:hypothetical protein n=1 Tax=Hyphomicrobium sp. TaxID=82 RepID=UPI0039E37296